MKPFLYLFFGKERALLVDTGAGAATRGRHAELIAKRPGNAGRRLHRWWRTRTRTATTRRAIRGSDGFHHAHSGDGGRRAEGSIQKWPEQSVIDRDRVIDVIAIPAQLFDRRTNSATGTISIGAAVCLRLCILASTRRLVEFTADKPVARGGMPHQQSTTPFVDYPVGTVYHERVN
jgi:hypothetical protein